MKELGIKKNFLGIEKQYSSFDKSKIVILPVPLEKTVTYGTGTKNGPSEILKASHYVEFYDEELEKELCFEMGICTLAPLTLNVGEQIKTIEKIYTAVKKLITKDKFVVTLGGEHSLSLAPIKAYIEKYNQFSVLQIDAHSDLRKSYRGTKYSHASVMARVAELTTNIVQVGIRAQCKEEVEFTRDRKITTFYAWDIRSGKYKNDWQKKVLSKLKRNVYITFDVDGFDPSLLPATGTPEPGGLYWDETMDLLRLVGKQRRIVGLDVVELAPSKYHPSSNYVAAKLVYKLMNYAFQT